MMKKFILYVGAFSVMLAICLPTSAKILMSPYLQAVTMQSVYVLVECDSETPVTVQYGTKQKYGKTALTESLARTDAAPATFVHRIKLTGLKAKSTYHYRAAQDDNTFTSDAIFVTAVKPNTAFRFCWMADMRTGTAIHDQIAAQVLAANPRFSLYGGDLCGNGSYDMFKKEFFLPNELKLDARVPFFNTPGNHEGWTTNIKAFTQAPASSSGTQDYYSFDYGDVHFLCLNTELPYDTKSSQYRFAATDLAASTKPWKVVYMHKHPYCAGGHGEDAMLQVMARQLFVPNKVDVVLNGHSHFYEHNLVEGIHYLIIGSAGAPLHDTGAAPYVVKAVKDYNYGIFDVTNTTMRIVVKNADDKELEAIELTKVKKKK